MSLNSWKKEFYIGRVRSAGKDPLKAVEHSLRKWEGLRPNNLKKHGMIISHAEVYNPKTHNSLPIDCTTCALCHSTLDEYDSIDCNECTITKATGSRCDGNNSPYSALLDDGNPKKMIKVLKKSQAYLKKEAK